MDNEIYLYGTVGSSFWDEEYFTATMVRDMLAGRTGPLTVRINSGGGIATEGQAIYSILRDYPDPVNVVVDGIAASAASLLAMAGDTITMREGSILMIHDPAHEWVDGRGTEDDHLRAAAGLRVCATAFAKIYAKFAGVTVDVAREIMRAETYYDGDQAVAAGFATATDTETAAQAVARFDYRFYAHAPEPLRRISAGLGAPKSKRAIMAMMAGTAVSRTKGNQMGNTKMKGQADDMADDDQITAAAEGDDDDQIDAAAEGDDDDQVDAADEGDDEKDKPVAAGADAVAILDLCATAGRPEGEARDMIARGLTLMQAVAETKAKREKENPVSGNRRGAVTARIQRDERSTRRIGMSMAISAQITRAQDVGGEGRAFMDMSLAEMAANCIGYKGPLRNAGQRQQVFMDASHATSDFPAIFENALNKVLLERYQLAEPTYRMISRRRDFTDFRAHPQVRAGDFPTLQPISENGEIKFGTFGESRETAILGSYGVGLNISRQMMINDDLGAIDDVLSDYGQSVANFEERTFYTFFLAATLSDTKAVFHADHNNLAGSGAAINVTSVSAGRAAIRKQTTIDGHAISLTPSILLVGPNKETEAEQLVATIQPNDNAKVNPFSGKLTPVVSAELTGNQWYLLASADRPGGACFVHGFLNGAAAPRVRTNEPFGQQGMAMTVEHDFGLGAVDYRGGWKNPGA